MYSQSNCSIPDRLVSVAPASAVPCTVDSHSVTHHRGNSPDGAFPTMVTRNIRAYNDTKKYKSKREHMKECIARHKPSVALIQETKMGSSTESRLSDDFPEYKIQFNHNVANQRMGGTATLYDPTEFSHVSEQHIIEPGYVSYIDLERHDGGKLTVINTYLHHESEKGERMLVKIREHFQALPAEARHPIIMAGDFNFLTKSEQHSKNSIPKHHLKRMSTFKSLMDALSLVELEQPTFTWSGSTGTQEVLDRVYLSRELVANTSGGFHPFAQVETGYPDSDHAPVVFGTRL